MARVSIIEQDGVMYDVYDASALHSSGEIGADGFEQTVNKVGSISANSTDLQYPTAKAVYTLFQSIVDGTNISY